LAERPEIVPDLDEPRFTIRLRFLPLLGWW